MSIKITVFFEQPFWVGIFEREENSKIEVARVVFGAEPKEVEVLEFILENHNRLRYSKPLKADVIKKEPNFKRKQKEIKKLMNAEGIGTKAQQAIKLQQEEKKLSKKEFNKEQKELRKQQQFEIKQEKRKEKHKGH